MATLSAHGTEIGRIVTITQTKAYMSDRTVLINYGSGWKIKGKLKAELTPQVAFDNAKARNAEKEAMRPAYMAYVRELHSISGQNARARLHETIKLMPDDCDGVWSECCDGYGDNVHADVDDIAKLCRLYKVALSELRAV